LIRDMFKDYRKLMVDTQLKVMKLERLRTQLKYANHGCRFTAEETIEGMTLKAQVITDMPRSVTNSYHSVTEDVALTYDQEMHSKNKVNKDLKYDIYHLEDIIEKQEQQLEVVDALIRSLNYKEQYTINCRYLQGMDEPETTKSFALKFGYGSRATTIRIEENSMNKMQEIYDKHSLIQK
jgi:DNA-directed RNA polymerase sigma subunit (sigma70/sigma32)